MADDKIATICCPGCGSAIVPNATNRCLQCLQKEHDIAADIPTEIVLYCCSGCKRYKDPPTHWVTAGFESRELLGLCLKKIRGLDKVTLIDANFIPTEIHSKRLRVCLKISKSIGNDQCLVGDVQVLYTIDGDFCSDCHRVEAKDFWKAKVQIRQRVDHKRTFLYLEQRMMAKNMHRLVSDVKSEGGGMDVFFPNERDALKLVEFISNTVVCQKHESKKLISHDEKSNTHNNKYSYCVELAPVCRDSLVCLPPRTARNLGNMSRLVLVHSATNQLILIDPKNAQIAKVNSLAYYKDPFKELVQKKYLKKFIVVDMEDSDVKYHSGMGHISSQHDVVDMWVERESEFGMGEQIFCRSHIGRNVNIGDVVLGYDMQTANYNNEQLETMKNEDIPDVILVKKYQGDKAYRNRRRKFRLKHMDTTDKNTQNSDYVGFLEDLEDDEEMMANVTTFAREETIPEETEEEETLDSPSVSDMMADINIS